MGYLPRQLERDFDSSMRTTVESVATDFTMDVEDRVIAASREIVVDSPIPSELMEVALLDATIASLLRARARAAVRGLRAGLSRNVIVAAAASEEGCSGSTLSYWDGYREAVGRGGLPLSS